MNPTIMNSKKLSILLALALTFTSGLFAEVILPKVIGHNMVLQRYKSVPIWGTASKGEKVTVTFGGQHKETVANDSGKWVVNLNPMQASELPRQMTITGTNTIVLKNILVGEVWLC